MRQPQGLSLQALSLQRSSVKVCASASSPQTGVAIEYSSRRVGCQADIKRCQLNPHRCVADNTARAIEGVSACFKCLFARHSQTERQRRRACWSPRPCAIGDRGQENAGGVKRMAEVAGVMRGKRGLIMGVANQRSLAWGIAKACRAHGAELAFTYQGDALKKRVEPLAEELGGIVVGDCDVTVPETIDAVFSALRSAWGAIDFVVHAIAFSDREQLGG